MAHEQPKCKTCMCMDCGKLIKVTEQSKHLKECPKRAIGPAGPTLSHSRQQSSPSEFRQKVTCALLDCRSDEQQLKVSLTLLHEGEDIIDRQVEEIKKLTKLIWDCHYLINMNNARDASELIIEKLNPEALKRRPKQALKGK